eukprot:3912028-Pyramimonas_sp.AAC.1
MQHLADAASLFVAPHAGSAEPPPALLSVGDRPPAVRHLAAHPAAPQLVQVQHSERRALQRLHGPAEGACVLE